MKYMNTELGSRNAIRIELGPDDLVGWDRTSAAIKGLLQVMADAEGRRHRKMEWADIIEPPKEEK